MTHTSTEQPEALRLADRMEWYCISHTIDTEMKDAAKELRRLHARVQELEEDLRLAQQGIGAEAYDMACEEMESYQIKRAKAGKEIGTTLSLVDGMAWVYGRLDELEASQAQRVPLPLSEILHYAGEQGFVRVQGDSAFHIFIDGTDIASCLEAMARDIERAHGITQEKQG